MSKAQVMTDTVGKVAGEDVGLEGVDVRTNAHRPLGADHVDTGRGGFTLQEGSSPEIVYYE